MKKTAKVLMQVLGVTALVGFGSIGAACAASTNGEGINEVVLFKIHDVGPEKDANGKVLYCSAGATFFNRTKTDIANASLTLKWTDDVIGETIDQEERAQREQKRTNSNAQKARYSTSDFTKKEIFLPIKLPPLKVNQQVSLKTKVDTDRCFLLLNDMDISIDNCGTVASGEKTSRRGCENMFRYISPKMADYYTEFKEVSQDELVSMEDAELDAAQDKIKKTYEETLAAIKDIAATSPETKEN